MKCYSGLSILILGVGVLLVSTADEVNSDVRGPSSAPGQHEETMRGPSDVPGQEEGTRPGPSGSPGGYEDTHTNNEKYNTDPLLNIKPLGPPTQPQVFPEIHEPTNRLTAACPAGAYTDEDGLVQCWKVYDEPCGGPLMQGRCVNGFACYGNSTLASGTCRYNGGCPAGPPPTPICSDFPVLYEDECGAKHCYKRKYSTCGDGSGECHPDFRCVDGVCNTCLPKNPLAPRPICGGIKDDYGRALTAFYNDDCGNFKCYTGIGQKCGKIQGGYWIGKCHPELKCSEGKCVQKTIKKTHCPVPSCSSGTTYKDQTTGCQACRKLKARGPCGGPGDIAGKCQEAKYCQGGNAYRVGTCKSTSTEEACEGKSPLTCTVPKCELGSYTNKCGCVHCTSVVLKAEGERCCGRKKCQAGLYCKNRHCTLIETEN